MRLEDYGVLGDTESVAIVGRNGNIDWLALPRFDSPACFAALVGSAENGHWTIAPCGHVNEVTRRYRRDSLVLETEFHTGDGVVRVTDAMPLRGKSPDVVRLVSGVAGRVIMRSDLRVRFDYGRLRPWVRKCEGGIVAMSGPDAVVLRSPVSFEGDECLRAEMVVGEGESVPFALTWFRSYDATPESPDVPRAIDETDAWWRNWAARCTYRGRYRDVVVRSLLTLKALTYAPSGGIVAAGTTSLPESLGGGRNWDYRYAWLRDATFTLLAMLHAGYRDEASRWRDWLLRAVAGNPEHIQIMYGVGGEPHLEERTLDWLSGYEQSTPVRIGNAAAGQLQLDVYGEIMDALHQARRHTIPPEEASWSLQRALVEWLEANWTRPDEGLWEIRTRRRQHTHSKVMIWAAFDRAVKAIERYGMSGPATRWSTLRDAVHADVCAHGFHRDLGAFTQAYDTGVMDASVLLIPSVGFLPGHDPRVRGTIAAIERTLMSDGFVLRYLTTPGKNADGVRGKEGAFLPCSFWLADAYALAGRRDDAERLFERVVAVKNDLGLLSEEYDTERRRLVGNFPQAFSHVALVNSALTIDGDQGGASVRARG